MTGTNSDAELQATKDALRRIRESGSDMSRAMEIDFFVAVPDETSGATVAQRAQALGFRVSVEADEATGQWTCFCTKSLVPDLAAVVAIEAQLAELSGDVGGYPDGFGSFGNAPTTRN